MPDMTAAPLVKVNGAQMADELDDAFVRLRVSLTTGAASHAEMRFVGVEEARGAFKVGDVLDVFAISPEPSEPPTKVFGGDIVSLGFEVTRGQTFVVVEALDLSYRLGNQTKIVSHENTTLGTLVDEIASDAGLTAEVDSSVGSQQFKHVQQSGTPHQFLTDLARAAGCEWFVKENSKLVVRPRKTASSVVTYTGAEDLREFSVRFNGVEQAASVVSRGWDPATKTTLTSTMTANGDAVVNAPKMVTASVGGTTVGKTATIAPNPMATAADADAAAKAVRSRLESSKISGRGEVDIDANLVPGCVIEIADVADQWNGKYYVTGVEHLFGARQTFVSRFTIGALEPTTLVDLFRSQPPSTPERLTSGVTIGIVTETADPDGLWRVKVQLPFLSDDNTSTWARVASAGAGGGRGFLVLPEKGDEVLVAFENGDAQQPYVLAGLWNGTSAAPDHDKMINNGKIMSRSYTSRLGHQLLFSDGDKPEELLVSIVTADKKTKLVMGEKSIELSASGKTPIKISNGKATIDMADSGDIKISGENVTIEAKQKLVATAKTDASVEGKMKLDLKAGTQASLKASASAEINGGGKTDIKGGMVGIN